MKQRLKSLRLRLLLPVIAMTLFVVILLTTLFSRGYIHMILQQEQEMNAVGFETVSQSVAPRINTSISEVRNILTNEQVTAYAELKFGSVTELIRARLRCRDYLRGEISRRSGIFGLLFMRGDGSLFGALPEGNFFLDDPEDNPLPRDIRTQILNVPVGQTVWAGPVSGETFYGFKNSATPDDVMIAAWKSVNARYGECYAMMLMDGAIVKEFFASLRDGKSSWHLFTQDHTEIYHTGPDACANPDLYLAESNTGNIFRDESGRPVCAFSMTMDSPAWTLVRVVSMEDYELVVRRVRRDVALLAGLVFLIALALYQLWLKKFMRQFGALQNGIIRMGQGDLEPVPAAPYTIAEFDRMQQEIDKTCLALTRQMDTIRQMERAQMELEARKKEQELIVRDLTMAREIQGSALPHTFPPFPERQEIDLFASMNPARDVGGDFYDYFFIDEDHLCLLIADVSGKGIPAAMFMMVAKRILEDSARLEHSVSEILEKTNGALYDSDQLKMFVTVWLGILELSTGRLTAANAGHEYPVLQREGGRFELLKDRHGFVIGGLPGIRYLEYQVTMRPGDKLFVYTDGLPEATAAGGEMFGTERMVEALNACPDGTPEEILRHVADTVDAFVGDAEQFDDLTMLCLTYRGPAPAAPEDTLWPGEGEEQGE